MKTLFFILTWAIAFQAKAGFNKLPILCNQIAGMNGSNDETISIGIRQPGDSPIIAVVKDHGDVTRMICRHTSTDLGVIQCRGVWAGDKSEALFSITTRTYVPFISLQRSQTEFGGQKLQGLCLQ